MSGSRLNHSKPLGEEDNLLFFLFLSFFLSFFFLFGKGLGVFTGNNEGNAQETVVGQPQRHKSVCFNRGSY